MHVPVFLKEVLEIFNPLQGQNFIDCNFGQGGHSFAILEKTAPSGKLLGFDLSKIQVEENKKAKEYIQSKRLTIANENFINLEKVIKEKDFKDINGVLFDLGFSSWHLDCSGKGFSFLNDEPLDMRYEEAKNAKCKMRNNSLTAEKIVNKYHKSGIEKILREYGEKRFAKRIAEQIIRSRKKERIKTTFQLKEIIKQATPVWYHGEKIDPATRTFQALRIAVNDELNNLEIAIPQALKIVKKNGIIIIISFHSLEDKIVKNYFRNESKNGNIQLLFKKPLVPTAEEIRVNPRARSAKLRAIIKT